MNCLPRHSPGSEGGARCGLQAGLPKLGIAPPGFRTVPSRLSDRAQAGPRDPWRSGAASRWLWVPSFTAVWGGGAGAGAAGGLPISRDQHLSQHQKTDPFSEATSLQPGRPLFRVHGHLDGDCEGSGGRSAGGGGNATTALTSFLSGKFLYLSHNLNLSSDTKSTTVDNGNTLSA